MRVPFRKMHGLGNDFLVIDAREQPVAPGAARIRELAHRRTGVGFDQLLILERAPDPAVHAAYRVFNADGAEVEQCGNGVRCLARLVADAADFNDAEVVLQGPTTRVVARLEPGSLVTVSMGEPDFTPAALPFEASEAADRYRLDLGDESVEVGAVSMGNPHVVLACEDVDRAPVDTLGAKISGHPRFPRKTNVEFMQITGRRRVKLRVFERGVGETQACGSGACGAVAVGRRWGSLDDSVEVALPGGTLSVKWPGPGQTLWLTGPAEEVFRGQIDL